MTSLSSGPIRRLLAAAVALTVVVAALTGCASARSDQAPTDAPFADVPVGNSTQGLVVDGIDREVLMHRPADLPEAPALVLMLHGGFGSAQQAEKDYPWDSLADREGFLMAYPNGDGRAWNAGGGCCGRPGAEGVDDIGFLTTVVHDLVEQQGVDPDRVYVAGFSNGALMAYTLACATDVFAAIGPVSGTQVGSCDSPRPTSVYAVNGTADEHITYDGGPPTKGVADVNGPSAPAMNAAWRDTDDCGEPTSTAATDVVTVSVAECADGRAVALATIEGYGHEWPSIEMDTGGTPQADETYRGWETTEALWTFFEAHPKQ